MPIEKIIALGAGSITVITIIWFAYAVVTRTVIRDYTSVDVYRPGLVAEDGDLKMTLDRVTYQSKYKAERIRPSASNHGGSISGREEVIIDGTLQNSGDTNVLMVWNDPPEDSSPLSMFSAIDGDGISVQERLHGFNPGCPSEPRGRRSSLIEIKPSQSVEFTVVFWNSKSARAEWVSDQVQLGTLPRLISPAIWHGDCGYARDSELVFLEFPATALEPPIPHDLYPFGAPTCKWIGDTSPNGRPYWNLAPPGAYDSCPQR